MNTTATTTVLDDLYAKLAAAAAKGPVDLVQQLDDGPLKTFLSALGGGAFAIDGEGGQLPTVESPPAHDRVIVSGSFAGLGLGPLAASVEFRTEADGTTLIGELALHGASDWRFPLAPWLELHGPEYAFTAADDPTVPVLGTAGAAIGTNGTRGKLALQAPSPLPDQWLYTGTLPEGTDLSHLFAFLGGVDFTASLPEPLNTVANLELREIGLAYNASTHSVSYISVKLGSSKDWSLPLLPKSAVDATSIAIEVTVADPARLGAVSWEITGTFAVGTGTIVVEAAYPPVSLTANLDPTTKIDIEDFVSRFVGHDVRELKGADITSFHLDLELSEPRSYELAAAVSLPISIPVVGNLTIDITEIAFQVQGDAGGSTGWISGTTVIGTDPQNAVTFVITAAYKGDTTGWVFSGRQTQGKIPVLELIKYLPGGWDPDSAGASLNIEDLAVELTPRTGAYSVSGKADATWDIFGSGFELEAAAAIAYDGTNYTGKFEATLDEAFGITNLGLHVSYSFAPGQTVYELDWKGLSGTYTVPKDGGDKILEIDVKGWTLGKLIEELVSFATGARFSLAAPWNVLDDIPLDCTLKFDLTSGAVSFTYPLSIDIGIASLSGISVTYDPNAEQKVSVTLAGRFVWQADSAKPLNWDATQPATTPAPPGGGNKYLELRVLALGQHVALVNPPQTYSVKTIVDSVGALATPKQNQLPVVGTGITYAPKSSWLIAADFGILKIDPPPKSGSAYFIDMALVFNDPDLYGLHLELEGPAAKIFAGLKLDVLYRKVTDTIGVYQAELQLPAYMRQFDVGEFSITLPTFAIAVYTNGDFVLDVGFPWNNDFSRSFTIQAIIPPGIPVIGAGGFYFGKLSSAAGGAYVPATTKGTFNPIIIFGIGLQVGLGKTIEKGPLKAGFTVTVLGIVEGVIARWHPNVAAADHQGGDQLAGPYYFKLKGTVGIAAHLFGSIDFAVVKASLDVSLIITASITYESYRAIPITVSASIDVRVTLEINLGLFKIKLHFSFSAKISETFTIGHDQVAPWDDASALEAPAADLRMRHGRLLAARSQRLYALAAGDVLTLSWTNLQAATTPLQLHAYVTPSFTVVGDGATTASQQTGAYVLLVWIDSVDPDGGQTGGADTSFEALAKQVLRWTAAAAQPNPVNASDVDDLVLSDDTLEKILAALADPSNPLPIAPSDADTFLQRNAVVNVSAPTTAGTATATFFPMMPQISLSVASLGIGPYTFDSFNSYDGTYLTYLQQYFSALDVQVQEESGGNGRAAAVAGGQTFSVASFVYADYFTLIARHMVQAARDALRDLKLPLPQGETIQATVDAINSVGGLDATHAYTPALLFEANAGHPLTPGLSVQIACAAATGETLTTIAERYTGKFTAAQLATANQALKGILSPGTAVQYPSLDPYTVPDSPLVSLSDIATALGVALGDLIAKSNVTTAALAGGAMLLLPVAHITAAGDTLGSIAASYGVPITALGDPVTANAGLVDLFAAGDTLQQQYLDVPHLPQYRLGDLLQEAQQSQAIQHLSGMVARFFLHGVRLPTDTSGTHEAGLFALTGQQLAVGASPSIAPFDVSLSCPDSVTWVQLS